MNKILFKNIIKYKRINRWMYKQEKNRIKYSRLNEITYKNPRIDPWTSLSDLLNQNLFTWSGFMFSCLFFFISRPLGMMSAKIKNYYRRIKDGYNTCGSLSCTQEIRTLILHSYFLELFRKHSRYTANICGMNCVFLIGLFSRTGLPFEHM